MFVMPLKILKKKVSEKYKNFIIWHDFYKFVW